MIKLIRNNLAILMSERSIKNSTLSLKTGISKNTISSTAQNDGKMIQLETINKICQVLNVGPAEFFSYIPYDIDFGIDIESISINYSFNNLYETNKFLLKSIDATLHLKVQKKLNITTDYVFKGKINEETNILIDDLYLNLSTNSSDFDNFWKEVPTSFASDITTRISSSFYFKLLEAITLDLATKNGVTDDIASSISQLTLKIISPQLNMLF